MSLAHRCLDQWPAILAVLGGVALTMGSGAFLAVWILAEIFRGALP